MKPSAKFRTAHLRKCTTSMSFDALVAQLVEHHHGKVGVNGSNPFEGSFFSNGDEYTEEHELWVKQRKKVL